MTAGMLARVRLRRLVGAILVVAAGLGLRAFGYELGLSFFLVKYGGSVFWGAMVYLLVAFIAGGRNVAGLAAVALAIAASVEFSRLFHTPQLDAFRLTMAGKLLLGRVFSLWNILAYALGIVAAAFADSRMQRP